MSSEILKSLTGLVSSLQKSLHKVRKQTRENADELSILRETFAVAYTDLNAKLDFQKGANAALLKEFADTHKSVEDFRVQAFQRSEQIAASLAQVKKENDDREMRQTVRDQSNVVSLQKLAASTDKGFSAVKTDVESLMTADVRLLRRIENLELFQNELLERAKKFMRPAACAAPGFKPELPVGHEWVNKKLSGVYSQLDEVEARLAALSTARRTEETAQLERRLEQLEKAAAKEALRDSLSLILKLLENPEFVKQAGFVVDISALMNLIIKVSDWKSCVNAIEKA
jgi:hypothetical protein